MNGNWYGYSGDPAAYIAAWRHIWTVFADLRVTNVTWVWCPNLTPANWDAYYPGNRYVDVIGVDGFSNTTYTWETFQQMFAGFFAHFASFTRASRNSWSKPRRTQGPGYRERASDRRRRSSRG